MRGIRLFALIAAACAVPISAGAADPEELFRDGYFQETHEGDLRSAIELYDQVVELREAPPALRAEAKARLAGCQEDLRAEDLASLMPVQTAAYVELRKPGEHLERLAKMLLAVGDPLREIGQTRYSVPSEPALVIPKNILLSSTLMNQAMASRGFALAITDVSAQSGVPSGVMVFHSGNALAIRGAIETIAQFVNPGEPISGHPVLEIHENGFELVVALTSRMVVAGTDRGLVSGVIGQLTDDKMPSLATTELFRLATANREEAMVYAFVNVPNALRIAQHHAQQVKGAAAELAAAQGLFDLMHMNSLSLALGSSSTELQLEAVLSLQEGQVNMAYNLVRTPPMSGRVLSLVPANAAAFVAVGINPEASENGRQDVITKAQAMQAITGMDIGREIFANIREAAAFILVPEEGKVERGMMPDLGFVLAVNDADRSEALWQYLLSIPSRVSSAAQAGPETTTAGGVQVTVYRIEDSSMVYLARADETIIVGSSLKAVTDSILALRGLGSVLDDAEMGNALARVNGETSLAIAANVGRLARVASLDATGDEAAMLKTVCSVADQTMLTVLVDETDTRLRLKACLANLPKVDAIVGKLAEAGMLTIVD